MRAEGQVTAIVEKVEKPGSKVIVQEENISTNHKLSRFVPMPLVGLGVCLSIVIAGWPVFRFLWRELFEPYPPFPTYDPADVVAVCDLLNLPASDEFCQDPLHQDWIMFRTMLERNFPPKQATYDALLVHIEDRLRFATGDVYGCDEYGMCYERVTFPGSIGSVSIYYYEDTRTVHSYEVSHPSLDSMPATKDEDD